MRRLFCNGQQRCGLAPFFKVYTRDVCLSCAPAYATLKICRILLSKSRTMRLCNSHNKTWTAWQKTGLQHVLANWEHASRGHAVKSADIIFDFSLDPHQCNSSESCMNCSDPAWQVLEHVFVCDTGTRRCPHRITRGLCVPSNTECPDCRLALHVQILLRKCASSAALCGYPR